MRTRTKVWLVIATTLVLLGCVLFAGVMSTLRWDFMKLSTVKYVTNAYEVSETFDGLSIKTDTADIVFAMSDNGNCKVECYEEETSRHFVTVEDNMLVINMNDSKSWYDYIDVSFGSPKITIYLPTTEYGSLFINGDTGDIEIPNDFMFKDVDISLSTGDVDFCASASNTVKIKTSTGAVRVDKNSVGTLELKLTTGRVTVSNVSCKDGVAVEVTTGKAMLTDVRCKNVVSSGSIGDISLENVIATEKISIERSTGDVRFDDSDATEIFVKTDTGDVMGSILTDKVFITQTDTGDIDVPKTVEGGRCEITTDTGNIKMTIKQ